RSPLHPYVLHSSPTRRSSDLVSAFTVQRVRAPFKRWRGSPQRGESICALTRAARPSPRIHPGGSADRCTRSTRKRAPHQLRALLPSPSRRCAEYMASSRWSVLLSRFVERRLATWRHSSTSCHRLSMSDSRESWGATFHT